MATPLFHPCNFNFQTQAIDVDGQSTSGGTSISGIEDFNQSDGGGFWRADFSGGDFGGDQPEERAATLAWRALKGIMKRGTRMVDVAFCDRWHQPILDLHHVPHSDTASFDDGTLYESGGVESKVKAILNGQTGGLRATILDISFVGEMDLIGGERFTLVHPTWGPRAYQIGTVEDIAGGKRLSFTPPIRGGVAVGDAVDFDNIRCRMQFVSATDPLSLGLYTTAAISFVEYMRSPDE